MIKNEFGKWLEEHGHIISDTDPYFKNVADSFERRSYSDILAFELALDSYLSSSPVTDFFINGDFIYVSKQKNGHKLKENRENIFNNRSSSRDKEINYPGIRKINANIFKRYTNDDGLKKRISKYETSIDDLLASIPHSIDLRGLLKKYPIDYPGLVEGETENSN